MTNEDIKCGIKARFLYNTVIFNNKSYDTFAITFRLSIRQPVAKPFTV